MLMRLCIPAGLWLALAAPVAAQTPHLATDLEKLSYAIGMRFGQNLAQQGFTKVDPASLALGVQDMLNGVNPRITMEQVRAAQEGVQAAMLKDQRDRAKRNLDDGLSFLAANKTADGVITLPSGVQYRVLDAGDGSGVQPTADDTVVVHYRGTLLTGQEFDSSYKRKEPIKFALNQVIQGWQEVVTNMKSGMTVETWIPPKMGYGENGSPPAIPPNATLYFKIELLDVKGDAG